MLFFYFAFCTVDLRFARYRMLGAENVHAQGCTLNSTFLSWYSARNDYIIPVSKPVLP